MALTAIPGWTATDTFGRAPVVTRTAPDGGVMMQTACTFIPGWTCTTAFGGPGTVRGRATPPSLGDLELSGYENGDFRTIGQLYVRYVGPDAQGDSPRRPDQNLGTVRVQDADAAGVPRPAHPVGVPRHLRRCRHEAELNRVAGRVVRHAQPGRGDRDEVVLGGQVRHADRREAHTPPAGSGQARAAG